MVGAKSKLDIEEGVNAIEEMVSDIEDLYEIASRFRKLDKIYTIGCGSSYWLSYFMAEFIRKASWDVQPVVASDFYFGNFPVDGKTLVVAFSQSGETSETIKAFKQAKSLGAQTLAIVNKKKSSLAKLSDIYYVTPVGKENILATKTFDSALLAAYAIAKGFNNEAVSDVKVLPKILKRALRLNTGPIVDALSGQQSCYTIGIGTDLAAAGELGVKLGEGALIQTSTLPAPEMSHGPKANCSGKIVILVAMQLKYSKIYKNIIKELNKAGAKVIVLAPLKVDYPADIIYELSGTNEIGAIGAVKLAQRIAVDTAVARGLDPDSPPTLKKFVTREDLS